VTQIEIPPNMPQRGNALTRAIGRILLAAAGWKIAGALPNEKKLIIAGGPHTSNWDFYLAMAAMLALGLRFSYMMKQEAFENPLGGLFRWLGGVEIDRDASRDVTAQMSDWFHSQDKAWLGITPEGTRSKVDKFKKGYLRIAKVTGAPLFIVGIDAPAKEIVLDKIWPLTGGEDEDNTRIQDYMLNRFTGVNSHNQ
jgi:1-acyl-sn-glycerol-3-phosphate acyltransferase